jgi:hypothetical protein
VITHAARVITHGVIVITHGVIVRYSAIRNGKQKKKKPPEGGL